MKRVPAGIGIAAVLWFFMFSPWTRPHMNFWVAMPVAAVVLTAIATRFFTEPVPDLRIDLKSILSGIFLAAVLWGIFWTGDKLSQSLFRFARPQVDLIYGLKASTDSVLIALLLLLVIGPAEEIFWRGFVQKRCMEAFGPDRGFLLATAAYTSIHIWSFNFMLVMAALVCGLFWGLLYRLRPKQLFPLILSHALWDVAAFVVFPI